MNKLTPAPRASPTFISENNGMVGRETITNYGLENALNNIPGAKA